MSKFRVGSAFKSIEEFEEARDLFHAISLSEGERQMVILALAELSLPNPGWLDALQTIALKMDNARTDGAPELFEKLRQIKIDYAAAVLAR